MFWKRRKEGSEPLTDLSAIAVDLHSHLLPGLDDGAQEMFETVHILTGLKELGYRKAIVTPHNQADFFENPSDRIRSKLDEVKEHLVKIGFEFEIEAASEYYFDHEFLQKIRNKELLSFGNNYVLFELSPTLPPMNFETIIFEMQMAGYRPVMAHPERYGYFHTPGKYLELTEKGIIMQMNIHSLSNSTSPQVRKAAISLIENELVTFAGSDTHSYQNIEIIRSLFSNPYLCKLVRSERLFNNQL
jgi:protein-tyrosine phosphatase